MLLELIRTLGNKYFAVERLVSLTNTKRYSKVSYSYIIVAASFLIMTLAYGAQSTFGVFFKPMSSEFGWSRAETSGPFALYLVLSGLLSIFSGRLSDRFGARKLVTFGGIMLGVGYILMSLVNSLWQLYLFYGVLVALGISAIYIPVVALIARWFKKRRGFISGISTAGVAFGIVILPPVASRIIESFQWRVPLIIMGAVMAVGITLLGQLLKNAPVTVDSPDGRKAKDNVNPQSEKGLTFKEALKTRPFWMIVVAWFFFGIFYQTGVVHIVPYATDLGMTALAAATILTVIGLTGTVGRLTLGYIGDRLGNLNTTFVSCVVIGLAYIGLSFSQGYWSLYLFAIIFGYLAAFGLLLVPIVAEYFGLKAVGILSGAIIFSNTIGGALGPWLAGGIFDATGGYHLAFIICAVAGILSGSIIWLTHIMHRHL